jgi:hypothetical protein
MSSKCRPVVGSSNRNSVPLRASPAGARRWRLGQVAGQLQALRLAAGQRRHRLAQAQVVQADVGQRLQLGEHLGSLAEQVSASATVSSSTSAMLHRRFQRSSLPAPRRGSAAVAVRAAQVDVGQELHLDMLEAEPPQVGQRPSPALKLKVPAV